ncbi:SH3 beta-barrel fold-containing protein [Spirosoma litoris]
MKKQVFTLGNTLRGVGLSSKVAFERAWLGLQLRAKMMNEPVRFTYVKETGEVRNALGYYGDDHKPKDTDTVSKVIKYFDLRANGWRSFRVDRLLSVG